MQLSQSEVSFKIEFKQVYKKPNCMLNLTSRWISHSIGIENICGINRWPNLLKLWNKQDCGIEQNAENQNGGILTQILNFDKIEKNKTKLQSENNNEMAIPCIINCLVLGFFGKSTRIFLLVLYLQRFVPRHATAHTQKRYQILKKWRTYN